MHHHSKMSLLISDKVRHYFIFSVAYSDCGRWFAKEGVSKGACKFLPGGRRCLDVTASMTTVRGSVRNFGCFHEGRFWLLDGGATWRRVEWRACQSLFKTGVNGYLHISSRVVLETSKANGKLFARICKTVTINLKQEEKKR